MQKDAVEQSISECATGDKRRWYISIIRRLTNFTQTDAESVFQECLFEAWKHRADVRGDAFKPYFATIIRRTCYRERNRTRTRPDRLPLRGGGPEFEAREDLAARVISGEMLDSLTEKDRATLEAWLEGEYGSKPNAWQSYVVRRALKARFSCPAT